MSFILRPYSKSIAFVGDDDKITYLLNQMAHRDEKSATSSRDIQVYQGNQYVLLLYLSDHSYNFYAVASY